MRIVILIHISIPVQLAGWYSPPHDAWRHIKGPQNRTNGNHHHQHSSIRWWASQASQNNVFFLFVQNAKMFFSIISFFLFLVILLLLSFVLYSPQSFSVTASLRVCSTVHCAHQRTYKIKIKKFVGNFLLTLYTVRREKNCVLSVYPCLAKCTTSIFRFGKRATCTVPLHCIAPMRTYMWLCVCVCHGLALGAERAYTCLSMQC